jgi:spermidine/putrescine transport system ATP-binding protein
VHISVRPERIRLTQEPAPGFTLVGTVRENIPVGTLVKSILVLTNGQEVVMSALVGGPIPTPGARLHVSWEPKDAVVLPLEDDDVLNAVSNIDLGGYMERLREVS